MKSAYMRLTIPEDDPKAYEWCKNQRHNLSLALRILIHRQIRANGMGNIFATDIDMDNDTDKPAKPVKKPKAKTRNEAPAKPYQATQGSNEQVSSHRVTDDDLKNMLM